MEQMVRSGLLSVNIWERAKQTLWVFYVKTKMITWLESNSLETFTFMICSLKIDLVFWFLPHEWNALYTMLCPEAQV